MSWPRPAFDLNLDPPPPRRRPPPPPPPRPLLHEDRTMPDRRPLPDDPAGHVTVGDRLAHPHDPERTLTILRELRATHPELCWRPDSTVANVCIRELAHRGRCGWEPDITRRMT